MSRHPGLNLAHADEKAHAEAEPLLFGFWVFLMSDLVLFALLFATYATMMGVTAGGPGPKQLFELGPAAIETAALLCSSLAYGMATLVMKYERGRVWLLFWLGAALLLGLVFLCFEIDDFVGMFAKGGGIGRSGQLSAFFALVGTHGLHVTFGCLWIVVMMIQVLVFGAERRDNKTERERLLADRVQTRILRLGLFWHFLDIVWIGIFSVVYLQGLTA
ncbi:cytochrome o ubiquinol oxidase subunit III [Acetobacteraceae bacterium KSS8]|uniref:Cytochrome o ubiquinol oxidase subunit III n=1 Tax=Endosaccharibacter trunci TaxID=2812733 RepID=A0ABT1W7J7_9PROT|nr:cytochrome o ubiquinol oxidase subunit III [Acetobacteraceae bacterium KSS8]